MRGRTCARKGIVGWLEAGVRRRWEEGKWARWGKDKRWLGAEEEGGRRRMVKIEVSATVPRNDVVWSAGKRQIVSFLKPILSMIRMIVNLLYKTSNLYRPSKPYPK